jgi:hypothetical protein
LLGIRRTNFGDKGTSNTSSAAANNNNVNNNAVASVVSVASNRRAQATMYSVASMLSFWRTLSTWISTWAEGFRATMTTEGT